MHRSAAYVPAAIGAILPSPVNGSQAVSRRSGAALQGARSFLAGEFGVSALDYGDILRRLGEQKVLSRELTDRLRGLGGFRNILVHGYLNIDPQKVYDALQRAPDDFTDFEAEIVAWLEKTQTAS